MPRHRPIVEELLHLLFVLFFAPLRLCVSFLVNFFLPNFAA